MPPTTTATNEKPSNYALYYQAEFNRPEYYPIQQSLNPALYRPVANWMGRLILPNPAQRAAVQGCLFEVYHADDAHQHLVGQVVYLRWSADSRVQTYVREVTRDVHLNAKARQSIQQHLIHPERLHQWSQVNPLESLAGSRPHDDMIVSLPEPVTVAADDQNGAAATLLIDYEPIQISGRFYGLVQFVAPIADTADQFRVVHFNRDTRQFDGADDSVRLPPVIADQNGILPSTSQALEQSPVNATGWYIYGTQDQDGMFVVQALAPRALLRLQPDEIVLDARKARHYIKRGAWAHAEAQKGRVASVLLAPTWPGVEAARAAWRAGDRALLLHVYGGIGGSQGEPVARSRLHFGHFAYGTAQVIHEPLADELVFDIRYHQVYTHNVDGLISGTFAWTRYMGDRQWGWLGTRPVCDVIVKLDAFTDDYDFGWVQQSGLGVLQRKLETMTARYRIGDGTGGTYVGPANNCSQDSNQALYAAIRHIEDRVKSSPEIQEWLQHNSREAVRLARLFALKEGLKHKLLPRSTARADWQQGAERLGIDQGPLRQLLLGLGSWRAILPRVASNTIAETFLDRGAMAWVLRTNQVGGHDPNIAPLVPLGF